MQLKIDPDRLKTLKLWILVPAANDQIHATFAQCLNNLYPVLAQYKIQTHMVYLPGDSLVTRARNNLADIFLAASSDPENHYALWLDCDILFSPESVIQMLSLDMDFLAAPYSKKGMHMDRISEAARENWPNDRVQAVAGTPNVNWLIGPVRCDEPMPLMEAGTGFWLMKRKVLTQLIEGGGAVKYRRCPEEKNHYGREFAYDFFRVGVWPETLEYLSEDWWFCREWRKLGGTLFGCMWIKTSHIGMYHYQMNMPAIADLLTATGGYINAETRVKKEGNHEIEQGNKVSSGNGRERSSGIGAAGSSGDIIPADLIARLTSHQAASAGDPGTLGG